MAWPLYQLSSGALALPPAGSDSSDIDNALMALLGSDATLMGLMPNLVYWDEAPAGATKFVIVSLVDEEDVPQLGGRSFEDALYMVKAVGLSKPSAPLASTVMKAAAARIDVLLDHQTLTVAGYAPMVMRREGRIRQTEVDDLDSSIRWHHRGGQYRVVMSVGAT